VARVEGPLERKKIRQVNMRGGKTKNKKKERRIRSSCTQSKKLHNASEDV